MVKFESIPEVDHNFVFLNRITQFSFPIGFLIKFKVQKSEINSRTCEAFSATNPHLTKKWSINYQTLSHS